MQHAREMVALAERMRRALKDEGAGAGAAGAAGAGAAGEGGEGGEGGEYAQLLLQSGIVSPVSKEVKSVVPGPPRDGTGPPL
jgi:hypothetical protein